jgi:hypothetical protein
MKHKVLLSTLGLGICLIALSSYQNGPAHGGAGNRSGSNGSPSCAASNCHGPESSSLALTLTLTDDATSMAVTNGKYIPGHTYTVSLLGVYSGTATYTHLGFQASVVNATNATSGTLGTAVPNTATFNTTGNINVIEHTTPLAKTGSQFLTSFKWTAPVAGNGDARIYARMLANNDNGDATDDTPNSIMSTFNETLATTAIHDVSKENQFSVYPNPAQDNINIKLNQLTAGKYNVNVTTIDGKSIMHSKADLSGGTMNLNISSLSKGVYLLNVQNETGNQTVRFVKN